MSWVKSVHACCIFVSSVSCDRSSRKCQATCSLRPATPPLALIHFTIGSICSTGSGKDAPAAPSASYAALTVWDAMTPTVIASAVAPRYVCPASDPGFAADAAGPDGVVPDVVPVGAVAPPATAVPGVVPFGAAAEPRSVVAPPGASSLGRTRGRRVRALVAGAARHGGQRDEREQRRAHRTPPETHHVTDRPLSTVPPQRRRQLPRTRVDYRGRRPAWAL